MREEALHGDVSLVKAWKGDAEGNLIFRKTSRNHNPAIATAGKVCSRHSRLSVSPWLAENNGRYLTNDLNRSINPPRVAKHGSICVLPCIYRRSALVAHSPSRLRSSAMVSSADCCS